MQTMLFIQANSLVLIIPHLYWYVQSQEVMVRLQLKTGIIS